MRSPLADDSGFKPTKKRRLIRLFLLAIQIYFQKLLNNYLIDYLAPKGLTIRFVFHIKTDNVEDQLFVNRLIP